MDNAFCRPSRRPGPLTIVVALVLLGVLVLELAGRSRANPLAIGGLAPAFALPILDRPGHTLRVGDLRGKVVLLETWNTACANCREAMPAAEELARRYGVEGFLVVHVAGQDLSDSTGMRRYLREIGVSGLVAVDDDRAFQGAYQIWGVPWSVLVDRDGRVAWQQAGVEIGARHPLMTEQGERRLMEVLRRPRHREEPG